MRAGAWRGINRDSCGTSHDGIRGQHRRLDHHRRLPVLWRSNGARCIIHDVGRTEQQHAIANNRFSSYPGAAVFWMNRGGSDITIDKNVMDGSNIAGSGQAIFSNGPQSYVGLYITNNNIINNTGRYGFFVDGTHNVGESATRAPSISGNLFNNNLQGYEPRFAIVRHVAGTPVTGPLRRLHQQQHLQQPRR